MGSGWLQTLVIAGGTAVTAVMIAALRSLLARPDRRGRAGLTSAVVVLWSIRPGHSPEDQDYALKVIRTLKAPPAPELPTDPPTISLPSVEAQELPAMVRSKPTRRRRRSGRSTGPAP
jgi:hypothetical protein